MTPEEVKNFNETRLKAERGDAMAQYDLGACYSCGKGVYIETVEAAKWYRKSAEQGYGWAQYTLGRCYEEGEGVPKDYVEAVKWYRKGAEQGTGFAQDKMGFCYRDGKGVLKDEVEAYAWFNLAAIQIRQVRSTLEMLEENMSYAQIQAAQKRTKELQELIKKNKAAAGTK